MIEFGGDVFVVLKGIHRWSEIGLDAITNMGGSVVFNVEEDRCFRRKCRGESYVFRDFKDLELAALNR
jgi:hypothetical protein